MTYSMLVNRNLTVAPAEGLIEPAVIGMIASRTRIASLVTGPQNGVVTINNTTGAFVYMPSPGWVGKDSFVYTLQDDDTACPTVVRGTANITVCEFGAWAAGPLL